MARGVLLGVKGSSLAGGRDTRVTHQFLDSESSLSSTACASCSLHHKKAKYKDTSRPTTMTQCNSATTNNRTHNSHIDLRRP